MISKEKFQKNVNKILEADIKIYENKILKVLTKVHEQQIYQWCKNVINHKVDIIKKLSDNKYKQWKLKELVIFRYAFSTNNTAYRVLLIKIKNKEFIELHLGKHEYYDQKRNELGI